MKLTQPEGFLVRIETRNYITTFWMERGVLCWRRQVKLWNRWN